MNVAITELDPAVMGGPGPAPLTGAIQLTPNPASELSAFFSLVNGFLESINSVSSANAKALPGSRPAELTSAAFGSNFTTSAKGTTSGAGIDKPAPRNPEEMVSKQPAQKKIASKESAKKEEATLQTFLPCSLSEPAPVSLPQLKLVRYATAPASPAKSSEPQPAQKTSTVERASDRLDGAPLLMTVVAAAANSREPAPSRKTAAVEQASEGLDAAPSVTTSAAEDLSRQSSSQVSIVPVRQEMSVEPVAFALRLTPEVLEPGNTPQVSAVKAQPDVHAPTAYSRSAPLAPQSSFAPEQDSYSRPDTSRLIPAEPVGEHSAANPVPLTAAATVTSGQIEQAPGPAVRTARIELPGSIADYAGTPAVPVPPIMPTEQRRMAGITQQSAAFTTGSDQKPQLGLPSAEEGSKPPKQPQQTPVAPKSANSPAVCHTALPLHPDREQDASELEPSKTKNEPNGKRETPAPMPEAKHTERSGAIFEMPAEIGPPIRSSIDRPSSPESDEVKITPPEVRQPAAPRLARQISLKLTAGDSARVNVDLSERAGKVQVSVRTPDHELAKSLQTDLGDLVGRLENKGFKAEAWVPTGAAHQPSGSSGSNTGYSQSGHSGFSSGRNANSQQQNGSNHRQHGRWTAEFEETLAADEKRSEKL